MSAFRIEREDQVGDLTLLVGIGQLMLEENQPQRQRCEAHLAVDYQFLTILVAYHDRAEEIVAIIGHCVLLVTCLVAIKELGYQVLQKLGNLFALPFIFALVE
jgi:hypothetical protein